MALFRAVMGEAFDQLEAPLRRFHSLRGQHLLQGQVQTEAPATLAARWFARCLGAPHQAMNGPIRFELDAGPGLEIWTRHFPLQLMRSQLSGERAHLIEQLGVVRLYFTLVEESGALRMQLDALRFFCLACPRWLMPRVQALETGRDGAVFFDVRARLPGLGTVAAYRGHLVLPAEGSAP